MSGAYMNHSRPRKQKTRNPSAAVDFAAIEGALAGLPERAPEPRANTKRYLIEQLREPLLDAMVSRHQSLETLAELLGRWGIAIRPETLRRYLGPITEHRRRAASPADKPPADKPARDDPPPTRAVRGAGSSERPGAGAVGSPEALARLDSALAEAPMPSVAPPVRPTPDLSSRFVPRPELPYDELIRRSQAQQVQKP